MEEHANGYDDVIITVGEQPVGGNEFLFSCTGSTLNIDLQNDLIFYGNGVTSTFSWIATDNPSVSGETTSLTASGTISDNLVNNSTTPEVVTYTVTPTSVTGTCVGIPFTIEITIDAAPVGNSGPLTVCSDIPLGPAAALSNFTTGAPAFAFNITSVVPSGSVFASAGNPTSGNGFSENELEDDVWINDSGFVQTVTYTIVPVSTLGCAGAPFAITLNVNSVPVGTGSLRSAVCSGAPLTIDPQDDITNGVISTFTWVASYDAGINGGGSAGAGSINEVLVNTTIGVLNVEYTIIPLSTSGCIGASFVITVPIEPRPVGGDDSPPAICTGETLNYDLQNNINTLGNSLTSTFEWIATDNANVTGEGITPSEFSIHHGSAGQHRRV